MADLQKGLEGLVNAFDEVGASYRYLVTVSKTGSSSGTDAILGAVETFAQKFSSVIFPQVTTKTLSIASLGPTVKKVVTGVTYGDLILKRGLERENSFFQWFNTTGEAVTAGKANAEWRTVTIQHLDSSNLPLATYQATIRPRVYHVSSLNSMREQITIETIQCAVDFFTRI